MIIDKQNVLGTETITVSAPSTDYIDQGAPCEPGMNENLQLCLTVTETFTAAGAGTIQVALQHDSDSAFGTVETIIETPAIPKATLVAGYQFFLPMPLGLNKRYLRAYYTVATGPMVTGKINAAFVLGVQKNKAYPDGLSL